MGDDPKDAETRREVPSPRWNRHTAPAAPDVVTPRGHATFDPTRERFEIGEEIGRGGMGRVVVARDTTLDRTVAIKQALDDDSRSLARFEHEVRITAQLEHPSIVPVHDVGRDGSGRPYYIMRRIEGEPLSDRVSAAADVRGRLALVPNVVAAVDAAAFAHARRVIHRDIKPWNILIGAYGETLLIDWGLARSLDEEDHSSGGTPGYMAPEQARGERTDARADVYSLGATLFHVLANQAAGETIDVAKLPEEVPRELVTIVAKATALDANARYADAGALAADLHAFLAGQLVGAHRYSPWERARRWVRKHRIAVATAAIAFVALVAVGVFAIVNVVRERNAAAAARAVAADRAEVMLLERASTLAPRDPTRAAALLREVDPASPHLGRARDIAAIAAAHGIAHGKLAHRGSVISVAITSDGKRLLSGGADGTVQLHDLVTGASRTLATGEVMAVGWTERETMATFRTQSDLRRIDLTTGVVSVLAEGVSDFWTTADDHLRYVRGTELVEHGAPPRVIARDMKSIVGRGDVAVIEGGGHIRVVDRNGERVVATLAPDAQVSSLSISENGKRAAAQIDHDVVEWDVATGAERARWPNTRTYLLMYVGEALFHRASGAAGMMDRLGPSGSGEILRGTFSVILHAPTARGTAVFGNDGTFAVISSGRPFRFLLDALPVRSVSGHRNSPIFAVGMNDGSIRWWDVRTVAPATVELPKGAMMCAFDKTTVYALEGTELVAVPRDGGELRAFPGTLFQSCVLAGNGIVGERVAVDPKRAATYIDITTRKTIEIEHAPVVDASTGTIVSTRGERDIVEVKTDGTFVTRATAPAEIVWISARGGWIAAALEDRRVLIVDPHGKSWFVAAPVPIDRVTVSPAGIIWMMSGSDIYRSDGRTVAKIATMQGSIVVVAALYDDAAAVLLRDASIWYANAAGLTLRAEAATVQRVSALAQRTVAVVDAGHTVDQIFLDTGERIRRRAPDLTIALSFGRDVRELAAQVTDQGVFIYEATVPDDPAALHAWLASATNAVIAHDRDALSWR